MKRKRYVELEQDVQRLDRANMLVIQALNDTVNRRSIDALERHREQDGCHYKATLYRSTGCTGGYVIITFYATNPGQKPYSTVSYLDDLPVDGSDGHPHGVLGARLRARREELIQAERGTR